MIDTLRRFFEINETAIFFIYGQVFFVLGLAVALQSWRHTRLELARSLAWLAAFGIMHGIHEWGVIFIPIQETYVGEQMLVYLRLLQIVLLALSFACLFKFGAELLRQPLPWLGVIPVIIVIIWGVVFVIPQLFTGSTGEIWYRDASIWARYVLGFPGGLLAAVGLRYQAEQQIKPLNLSYIYRTLLVAGIAFGAYAVLAGLLVSPGDFFPSNLINDALLIDNIGVPAPVLRSFAGLVMAVTFIRVLDVFDVEVDRIIERMEKAQSLAAERERVGRELHDGAIQQIYTAGLLLESAQKKVGDNQELGWRLDRAMLAMNESIAGLRAYLGDLRSGPAQVSLVDGLQQQAEDPRFAALMRIELDLEVDGQDTLDPVRTTRVLAILGEALSNAARHAQARHVVIQAKKENGQFLMSIEDDGCGFEVNASEFGYGLRDMRDRARLLGTELKIDSEFGRGTRISIELPWEAA